MPVPPIPAFYPGTGGACKFTLGASQNQAAPGLTLQDMIDAYEAADTDTKRQFLQTMAVAAELNPQGLVGAMDNANENQVVQFWTPMIDGVFGRNLITGSMAIIPSCAMPYLEVNQIDGPGTLKVIGGVQQECTVSPDIGIGDLQLSICSDQSGGEFADVAPIKDVNVAVLIAPDGETTDLQYKQYVCDALAALLQCCNPCANLDPSLTLTQRGVTGHYKSPQITTLDLVLLYNFSFEFPISTEYEPGTSPDDGDAIRKIGYFRWVDNAGNYLDLDWLNGTPQRKDAKDIACMEIKQFDVHLSPGVSCDIDVFTRGVIFARRPNQLNSPTVSPP